MGSSSSLLLGLVYGVGSFLAFVLEIVFLVVVLTTVRRHRPDAYGTLAAAAGVGLFGVIASSIAYNVAPVLMRSGDSDVHTFMSVQAALSAFFTLVRTLGTVLLVVGVARIARPPAAPGALADPGRYS